MRSNTSDIRSSAVYRSPLPPSWPFINGPCMENEPPGTSAAVSPGPWARPSPPAAIEDEANNLAAGSDVDLPQGADGPPSCSSFKRPTPPVPPAFPTTKRSPRSAQHAPAPRQGQEGGGPETPSPPAELTSQPSAPCHDRSETRDRSITPHGRTGTPSVRLGTLPARIAPRAIRATHARRGTSNPRLCRHPSRGSVPAVARRQVNVRMPDELHALIRENAQHLGITDSEFIRQAIVAWAARNEALRAHGKKTAPLDVDKYLRALGREP